MNEPITIPATLEGVTRKKDKSVSLRFNSLFEMTTEDFTELDKLFQTGGWLVFAEKQLTHEDIPDEDISNPDLKSPSQRLRNILYVYHMEKDGDPAKFRAFYESTMEKYITKIKESID